MLTIAANFDSENCKNTVLFYFFPIDTFVTKIYQLFFILHDELIRACAVNKLENK